jgi:hypothetical protein
MNEAALTNRNFILVSEYPTDSCQLDTGLEIKGMKFMTENDYYIGLLGALRVEHEKKGGHGHSQVQ